MNNYERIPAELKALRQWVVWSLEDIGAAKPTKIPYSTNGKMANVNESETWTDFNSAVAASKNYSGIGFVFTDTDNFSFIDLDDTNGDQAALDRQIKIFREFDSWSEISPSGKGLHVIVKGTVPAGRRRNFIEIYSSQRYATFTGNVYNDKPIKDCQDKLMSLWEQMGSGPVATNIYKGDEKEKQNDTEIIRQASSAVNGDKFNTLNSGKWQDIYPSQSEADYALIDMLAFYTQNRNQIIRLFRASGLGKRDKANRSDYLSWMINKSFDRMLPPIDFDGFKIALDDKVNQLNLPLDKVTVQPQSIASQSSLSLPPGLVGEIAQFIYAAAPRPVPEIALAAAIGLMAGICGRAYNISGTGLNQYILVLAKTGRGKESAASGIDKLMGHQSVKMGVPTSKRFRGPGIINSGQALVKYLSNTSNCFVSVLGEFGMTIERISNPAASPSDKMLYQMLLDLYNKSGHTQTFQASIYAKREDNVDITDSPALTILGESTHKTFYDALTEEMISAGLLPRFLIIEYNGDRVDLNENHSSVQPTMMLAEKFASLIAYVEQIMHTKRVIEIKVENQAAIELRTFDRYATNKINSEKNDVIAELWNRAHMKAIRLAGLLAVGCNMSDPVVISSYVKWSIDLVQNDIKSLSQKFEEGSIGANSYEVKQLNETSRMIKDYLIREWDYIKKYSNGKNTKQMYDAKIVTLAYLNKRLAAVACFRLDKSGATVSLKRALQALLDADKIREMDKKTLAEKFGTTQRAFIVSDINLLDQ